MTQRRNSYSNEIDGNIKSEIVFEGYIFFLRKEIRDLLFRDIKSTSFKALKLEFQELKELAENSNSNKYIIGNSTKLVDLVEEIFSNKIYKDRHQHDLETKKTENRYKIIQYCWDKLLGWLNEALPYHCSPKNLKRYLRILTKLSYSIRESDPIDDNSDENEVPQPIGNSKHERSLTLV